jgi:hypothetical protein
MYVKRRVIIRGEKIDGHFVIELQQCHSNFSKIFKTKATTMDFEVAKKWLDYDNYIHQGSLITKNIK